MILLSHWLIISPKHFLLSSLSMMVSMTGLTVLLTESSHKNNVHNFIIDSGRHISSLSSYDVLAKDLFTLAHYLFSHVNIILYHAYSKYLMVKYSQKAINWFMKFVNIFPLEKLTTIQLEVANYTKIGLAEHML